MSEKTKIEWADSTGNPWIGCTKISPGCAHCYAATMDHQRFSRTLGGGTKAKPISHWGKGAPRVRSKGFWKDALRWEKQAAMELNDWEGHAALHGGHAHYEKPVPPRIFPSLCDWLDEEVPIEWLADLLKLIYETPNLDWLLLTKRPENFIHLLGWALGCSMGSGFLKDLAFAEWLRDWIIGHKAPANVWVGVSVENQEYADKRIPELLKIPARVRFLSVEPMLGAVDFTRLLRGSPCSRCGNDDKQVGRCFCGLQTESEINWVIFGGESGKGARACNVDWIRLGVKQCQAAGVAVFVKQLGKLPLEGFVSAASGKVDGVIPLELKDLKGGDMAEWPEDLRVREFPGAGAQVLADCHKEEIK